MAATVYTMTITKNGSSDTYEFELPDNQADLLVTAVDIENGIITVQSTATPLYATESPRKDAGRASGDYKIGDLYEGNLGELVGRTVNLGLDSDKNVIDFSVNDAKVVFAAVQAKEGNTSIEFGDSKKDYLVAADKTKYYWSTMADETSSITRTYTITGNGDTLAVDFYDDDNGQWDSGTTPVGADDPFDYAKLVLNPTGTISCAVLENWEGLIVATSAEDGVATETKNNTKDFSSFTVVEGGLYVDPDDITAGDVIYYNDTDKFAEIYNASVTGELEKVYTSSAVLDGTEYKWAFAEDYETNARYYDDDNDKYVDVDEKWLLAADTTEDVTFTLDRNNNAVLIETVQGEEVTTTHDYIITAAPVAYLNGVDQMMNIGVSDGTATTLKIALADLKYVEGSEKTTWTAKYTAAGNAAVDKKTEATAFYLEDKDGNSVGAAKAALSTVYPIDTLLTVTSNEDGDVIGLKSNAITTTMSTVATDKAAVKPGLTQLVTAAGKVALSDDTNIYIITGKKDDATQSDMKVTKVAYADYAKTTQTGSTDLSTDATTALAGDYVSIYVTNTKATDIVIDASAKAATPTVAQNAIFADSDVAETVVGVVKSVKTGLDADQDATELKEITILNGANPKGVTYDEIAANKMATKNTLVSIDLDENGAVLDVTTVAAWDEGGVPTDIEVGEYVTDTRTNLNSTEYVRVGANTIRPTATAFVAFFDGSNYTTTSIGAINRKTDEYGTLTYYVSELNGNDIASEIIIASGDNEPRPAVLGTAVFTFNQFDGEIDTSATGFATYTGDLADGAKIGLQAYDGTTWELVGGAAKTATSPVTTTEPADIKADTYYRLVVSAEGYDPAFVYMDGGKTDAAVIDGVTAASITLASTDATTAKTSQLAFEDQFGDAIAISDLTITDAEMTDGSIDDGTDAWTLAISADPISNTG